jgi:hypothetical protein
MHTDEYEISLHREMSLCADRVQSLRRSLAELDGEHASTAGDRKLDRRQDLADALAVWEARHREYEQLFRLMKA